MQIVDNDVKYLVLFSNLFTCILNASNNSTTTLKL